MSFKSSKGKQKLFVNNYEIVVFVTGVVSIPVSMYPTVLQQPAIHVINAIPQSSQGTFSISPSPPQQTAAITTIAPKQENGSGDGGDRIEVVTMDSTQITTQDELEHNT